MDKGSDLSRAVAKGIKQKEQDDMLLGCGGIVLIAVGVIIGVFTHWIIGLIVFIFLAGWLGSKYYRE